jgi:hypothetical protein
MGTILAAHHDEGMVKEIIQMARNGSWRAKEAIGNILAAHHDEGMVKYIMWIARNGDRSAQNAMGTIIKIRSKQQIDNDMRARESRLSERGQGDRSGEGSSQGGQLLDQVRRVLDEYPQMKERENKLKQERDQAQTQLTRIQQDLNRTLEQFTKAEQERDRAQGERDRFQRQLGDAERERDRLQTQLTNALQERNQAQEQLRQGQQVGERGQSSRGDSRANDALPTTVEGIEGQLEGEHRRQQESRERVGRLREHIQRIIWEQGDGPQNERLNELLKYPMEGILKDQHLVEEIYPPDDQPAQDRIVLRQSLNKALRHRLRSLYLTLVAEYIPSGLSTNDISGAFGNQLQEQMEAHNRPSQEWIDAIEDIQQELTGRRPNHTRR